MNIESAFSVMLNQISFNRPDDKPFQIMALLEAGFDGDDIDNLFRAYDATIAYCGNSADFLHEYLFNAIF